MKILLNKFFNQASCLLKLLLIIATFNIGCSEGCEEMEHAKYPPNDTHILKNSGELHITTKGFGAINQVLTEHLRQYIAEKLGTTSTNDFSVCIPPPKNSFQLWTINSENICNNKSLRGEACSRQSKIGCSFSFSIQKAILAVPQNTDEHLRLIITLNNIYGIISDSYLSCDKTLVDGKSNGNHGTITLTIPFSFQQDKGIKIQTGNPKIVFDKVNIKASGTISCIDSATTQHIKTLLTDYFSNILGGDEFCKPCKIQKQGCDVKNGKPCFEAKNSLCDKNETCDPERFVCLKKDTKSCTDRTVGIEGLIRASNFTNIISVPKPNTYLMVRANRLNDITGTTDPAELSIRFDSGFKPTQDSWCAPSPNLKRPNHIGVVQSQTLQEGSFPGTHTPFEIAFAYNKIALNDFVWAMWASGALCFDINTEEMPTLTGLIVGQVMPSMLTLFSDAEKAPVRMRMRALDSPKLTLGKNTLKRGEGGELLPDDALFNLTIDHFEAELFTFLKDRWVRVATVTLKIDMNFGINIARGTDPNNTNLIIPRPEIVFDNASNATKVISISNTALLQESNSELAENFQIKLPPILTMVTKNFMKKVMPIGKVFLGPLKLNIENQDIRGIDNNEYLGLFFHASELQHPTALTEYMFPYIQRMEIEKIGTPRISERHSNNLRERRLIELPVHRYIAQGDQLKAYDGKFEYRFKVDDSDWSNYWESENDSIFIKDLQLVHDGDHEIEVEARLPNLPDTTSLKKVRFHVNTGKKVSSLHEDEVQHETNEEGCSNTNSKSNLFVILFTIISLIVFAKFRDRKTYLASSLLILFSTTLIACTINEDYKIVLNEDTNTDDKPDSCENLGCPACPFNQRITCEYKVCGCAPLQRQFGYGEYLSIAGEGSKLAVAGYDTDNKALIMQFVEGGELKDNGWKKIDEKGGAGKYTSLVLKNGTAYITYQGDQKLKLAVVHPDGSSKIVTLESTKPSGEWTQIVNKNNKLEILYTATDTDQYNNKFSELRHLTVPLEPELKASKLDIPKVLAREKTARPCNDECTEKNKYCLPKTKKCVQPTDDCDMSCANGFICVATECEKYFENHPAYALAVALHTHLISTPTGLSAVYYNGYTGLSYLTEYDGTKWENPIPLADFPSTFASIAMDNQNVQHVSFLNTQRLELLYHTESANEVVAKGQWQSSSTGNIFDYIVGQGMRLTFKGLTPYLFFQDTNSGTIKVASRNSGTWDLAIAVPPKNKHQFRGFYLSLYNDGSNAWLVEQTIDSSSEKRITKPYLHRFLL